MPSDRSPWDDRHTESLATGDYPRDPDPFLLDHAPEIIRALPTSGRALDIAAGLGRNTFWLAQPHQGARPLAGTNKGKGLHVTAIDASAVAVAHLAGRARAEGLPIDARVLDLATDPLPAGPFDLIVNTLFLLRDLAPQIEDRLVPGGLLVFVTLLEGGSGPPVVHKEFLLRRGELATLFPNLHTLDLREDPPDTTRSLASLLACRPSPTPGPSPSV